MNQGRYWKIGVRNYLIDKIRNLPWLARQSPGSLPRAGALRNISGVQTSTAYNRLMFSSGYDLEMGWGYTSDYETSQHQLGWELMSKRMRPSVTFYSITIKQQDDVGEKSAVIFTKPPELQQADWWLPSWLISMYSTWASDSFQRKISRAIQTWFKFSVYGGITCKATGTLLNNKW